MSTSKDRVRFFLPEKYFLNRPTQSGMTRSACIDVLIRAFGSNNWSAFMTAQPRGFWITCRPSQFARFIVYRHQFGSCVNGIRDLMPELTRPMTVYERIGTAANVSADTAKRVLCAAGYSIGQPELPLGAAALDVDVSDNFEKEGPHNGHR